MDQREHDGTIGLRQQGSGTPFPVSPSGRKLGRERVPPTPAGTLPASKRRWQASCAGSPHKRAAAPLWIPREHFTQGVTVCVTPCRASLRRLNADGKATKTLGESAREAGTEPLVITQGGKPVAVLLPLENADLETVSLSTNRRFLELIERSRFTAGRRRRTLQRGSPPATSYFPAQN
jgi:antitoxin (DNA-binding transcriptional repressor) of toxin-antitoxin stability system